MHGRFAAGRDPAVQWHAESDRVFCMTSMPGNRVITGGNPNGAIAMWDARVGGRPEYTLSGHTDAVLALAVVPSAKLLFSASADSTVRMWSLETLHNIMLFEGHKGYVTALFALAPERSNTIYIFSGGDDRTVKQWNTAGGICVSTYRGHTSPVNAISGTENYMFSGGNDALLKVWDPNSHMCVRTIEGHSDSIWAICALEDGRVITGCADASIRVWRDPVEDDTLIAELNAHRGKIRMILCFGPIMFSASTDTTINVWNLESGSLIETLRTHDKQVSALTLENNQLCSCGFDGKIARWDVRELLVKKQPIQPYSALSMLLAKEAEVTRRKVEEINLIRSKRHQKAATPDDVAKIHNELPINYVISRLEYRAESTRLSRELLLYLPFLVCFIFVFTLRRPIEEGYFLVHSVNSNLADATLPSFKLDRTFAEVTDVGWYETWLELVMQELWADAADVTKERSLFKGQNILIGAVRLRQQRVTSTSCEFNEYFWDEKSNEKFGFTQDATVCYEVKVSDGTMDRQPFRCPARLPDCIPDNTSIKILGLGPNGFLYNEDAGAGLVGQLQTYSRGGFFADFSFNDSFAKVTEKRDALKKLQFVDSVATRYVDLSFFVYNPGIDSFVKFRYVFEMPYGGTWFPLKQASVFSVFMSQNNVALAFEFVLLAMILACYGLLVNEAIAEKRKRRFLAFFLNTWNFLEFANLAIFIIVFSFRWDWMAKSGKINWQEIFDNAEYPRNLEDLQENFDLQVRLNGVNMILTFLKVLKFVRLNNRLNVLTRTLDAVQQNLFGVLIVFLFVTLGFVLMGHTLYGGALFEFHSIAMTFSTLLRALLGDAPYDEMSLEHRTLTVVFYWGFMIFCLFILLNFLVAIISDGFSDVSKKQTKVPMDEAIAKAMKDTTSNICGGDEDEEENDEQKKEGDGGKRSKKAKVNYFEHRSQSYKIHAALWEGLAMKRLELMDKDAAERNDFDELDRTFISLRDVHNLIPYDLRSFTAEEITDNTWKELAWEYHTQQMAHNEEEAHEQEQLIEQEVEQALRAMKHSTTIMDNIKARIKLQFTQVQRIANKVMGVAAGER